jgi:hypothetical protein
MFKTSTLFSPAREILTVQIAIQTEPTGVDFRKPDTPISHIFLTLSSTLYLNEQNTAQPTDWHMANDKQNERFVKIIKGRLKSNIGSLCRDVSWVGRRGTCVLP